MANFSSQPASLIYFANQAFDPQEPDEHRLPYDAIGTGFWRIILG